MTPGELVRLLGKELRRRPYLIGFLVATVGLAVWALIPLPKRAIKEVIRSAERTIEARDAEALRPLLAADFYSPETQTDRDATVALLKDIFRDVLSLDIRIKRVRTKVQGDRATSDVDFYIWGTVRGGDVYSQITFSGLEAGGSRLNPLERCRLTFVKETDGYWRVSSARLLGVVKD